MTPDLICVLDQVSGEAVGSETIHAVAEGNGPVHALDSALRKALNIARQLLCVTIEPAW